MRPSLPATSPRPPRAQRATARVARWRSSAPGLALAIALAVGATVLGHTFRLVGAPVFALVSGVLVTLFAGRRAALEPGVSVAASSVLKGSIVALGTGLSLTEVVATGRASRPILLGTLTIALGAAWLVGGWLGVPRDLKTLVGVGTAICGASAIAASDAVIDAAESDVAYAVATIFTFNVVAILTFPTFGHLLHLSPHAFGLWSGTAINDMSSVVVATAVYSHASLDYGVVVKLTRTLFIVPIVVALSTARARSTSPDARRGLSGHLRNARRAFPAFIAWFLLAVVANTVGVIPSAWHGSLAQLATFMITVALAGVGLSTNLRDLARAGLRPLALGAILWVLVTLSSLGLGVLTSRP